MGATPTFMIVADYGWAERILCGGSYEQDAQALLSALEEAKRRRERPTERSKPTPEQERALQEVLDGEREAHVVRHSRRDYWYGRSRMNRWPLWTSWLLAPSPDSRQIVRELIQLRRTGVDV